MILFFSVLQMRPPDRRKGHLEPMFRYTKATVVREVIVWIVALMTLLPFYFLVITALKPCEELLTTGLGPAEPAHRPRTSPRC